MKAVTDLKEREQATDFTVGSFTETIYDLVKLLSEEFNPNKCNRAIMRLLVCSYETWNWSWLP